MKIFPSEPEVNLYNDGFEEDDALQRKSVGQSLSNLVERIEDPMVLAVDGGWGTGKTYFLKRWVGAHKQQNNVTAETVYFDAFAHDFVSDPLPALVSAVSERLPKNEAALERLKAAAFKLVKPIARVGLAVATYGITEALAPAADAAVEKLSEEADKALNAYWKREEGRRVAMQEFRTALGALVAANTEKKRQGAGLVIVIDELDRCRPDYALEVLEVIKHFFAVRGVIFVLGVNLLSLENSVKARYGAEIDASAYLRKFINVTLNLPNEIEIKGQSQQASLVFLQMQSKAMNIPDYIAEPLERHVKLVSRRNSISIRDIGKILSAVALLDLDALHESTVGGWIHVTVALLVARIVHPVMYAKLLNTSFTEEDLEVYFDATHERRSEKLNGERNANYDHQAWLAFYGWMFLATEGQPDNVKPGDVQRFQRFFDRHYALVSWRDLPKIVHRNYLDLFSATNT